MANKIEELFRQLTLTGKIVVLTLFLVPIFLLASLRDETYHLGFFAISMWFILVALIAYKKYYDWRESERKSVKTIEAHVIEKIYDITGKSVSDSQIKAIKDSNGQWSLPTDMKNAICEVFISEDVPGQKVIVMLFGKWVPKAAETYMKHHRGKIMAKDIGIL